MFDQLLKTKLYIPPVHPGLIDRAALLEKIRLGSRQGRRLFLISAPAGSGKTTLAAEWAQSCDCSTSWLTLDPGDNDPVHFWHYLIAAIQTVQPHLGNHLIPFLKTNPLPQVSLITGLLNELSDLSQPLFIVLDDYQNIDHPAIHEVVNALLDHLPQKIYLLITSRVDPPLQLARRRGRAELCEVRTIDLRFHLAELEELFNGRMKLGLSSAELALLESRTEGWVAGLQMAALSMQGIEDKGAFITAFSGTDRFIADYLVEEVLQRQPVPLRTFMLQTSILDRLNASLCDAVTGRDDSQSVLQDLERSNLFLISLDNRREWYRYHHLFAFLLRQALNQELPGNEILNLQRRAILWYRQKGLIIEAAAYALEVKDFESALDLVVLAAPQFFFNNELNTLLKWGKMIPSALLFNSPALCVSLAWAANATGQSAECDHYIDLMEQICGLAVEEIMGNSTSGKDLPEALFNGLVEIGIIKTHQFFNRRAFTEAIDHADRLLPFLIPENDSQAFLFSPPSHLRAPTLFTRGMARQILGELSLACKDFQESYRLGLKNQNLHIVVLSLAHFGEVQAQQGLLHEAYTIFQQALQAPSQSSFFTALPLVQMGILHYEWNELEPAEKLLRQGMEVARPLNVFEAIIPAGFYLTYIKLEQGDDRGVRDIIDLLEQYLPGFPLQVKFAIETLKALYASERGDIQTAHAWAMTALSAKMEEILIFGHQFSLTLIRVLLRLNFLEDAARLATQLRKSAQANAAQGLEVGTLCLLAVISSRQSRPEAASQYLDQALNAGQKEGFMRSFVSMGEPMQTLLKEALSSSSQKEYILRLLKAFPQVNEPASLTGQSLSDPLSEREIEVLRCMAGGLSNQETARQLFVSTNTVKKHIQHIFLKLDVTTRLQAIEVASKLGILS